MTFLEIVQALARESGTIATEGRPLSVVGVSGREARMVTWTRQAYTRIQTSHSDNWKWLQDAFVGPIFAGINTYDAGALNATRLGRWKTATRWTVHIDGAPLADEAPVYYRDWSVMQSDRLRGPDRHKAGRPVEWSIDTRNRVVLWPTPDAAGMLRGDYTKAPQMLTANADVPEMPEPFHDLIWMTALVSVAAFDESTGQVGIWEAQRKILMATLEREQLPPLEMKPHRVWP